LEVAVDDENVEPKFVYHADLVDWNEAKSRCEADRMWLATLDNADDLTEARRIIATALVSEVAPDFVMQTWIGLKGTMAMSGDVTWNWIQDDSPVGFTNWWQGSATEGSEPTRYGRWGNPELCVEMSMQGTWNNQLCHCVPGVSYY